MVAMSTRRAGSTADMANCTGEPLLYSGLSLPNSPDCEVFDALAFATVRSGTQSYISVYTCRRNVEGKACFNIGHRKSLHKLNRASGGLKSRDTRGKSQVK